MSALFMAAYLFMAPHSAMAIQNASPAFVPSQMQVCATVADGQVYEYTARNC
jgi:hypothetical protein